MADGFTSPLPDNVRTMLERGRGLKSGGYEIVAACEDPNLTRAVLKTVLEADLKFTYHLHGLQTAVKDIASEALQRYIDRVKAPHTTDEEVKAVAPLIRNLPADRLASQEYRSVAEDLDLPTIIRLAGYLLGPQPLPKEALGITDEILLDSGYDIPGIEG